jgi:GMP synthase (glutamine-hydrolysing)
VIAIFDFGSQYSHLIARRIHELGAVARFYSYETTADKLLADGIKGIIFSGGPASIYNRGAPRPAKEIFALGLPILGICYGQQLLADYLGGKVEHGDRHEYGATTVKLVGNDPLLAGLNPVEEVWMSHGDRISLPAECRIIASSENSPHAAFHVDHLYGIQWHPEVSHTASGKKLLGNFISLCGCEKNLNPVSMIDSLVKLIREEVGEERVIIGLSGGIDSSVATALCAKAIGGQLSAVYIDTGLMRAGESDVVERVARKFGPRFLRINAQKRFLSRLAGIVDPEQKRHVIGEEFIRLFEEVARDEQATFLAQGTIFPDIIESGGQNNQAALIKSHHNVGALPKKMEFRGIIEPLKYMYKDEVRNLARQLGLSRTLIDRQPFPGPGLAIRIIGEVTEERLDLLRQADSILRAEIEQTDLTDQLWQWFAVLLTNKSTAVKGDQRGYGYIIAIRMVESKEAMTARFSRPDWDLLARLSTKIVNELPAISRVVYDITNKPPATIEWE